VRYLVNCSYFAKNYSGWQKQKNSKSIQQEIEKSFEKIFQKEIKIFGSSRTDRGVHAENQFFHFDIDENFDEKILIFKLNSLLSKDISINSIVSIESNFHSRFDAVYRRYCYKITTKKNPFLQESHYFFQKKLCIKTINEVCEILKNKEDFKIFSKEGSDVKNFFCKIFEIKVVENEYEVLFFIKANRFLRGMVRLLVGFLIKVGEKKINILEVENILEKKSFEKRPYAVPAHGLFLIEVSYK
jgi:tRNA pseudouridine38-40 synthase